MVKSVNGEDALHLLVCSTYQKECAAIIQTEAWKNVYLRIVAKTAL
jgi:hypothetical protein